MLIVSDDEILTCGVDEAGRGPIAGGVFAAAVILPRDFCDPRIKDSKKLSHKLLLELEALIKEVALSWAVCEATVQQIDNINILQATFEAMNQAVLRLVPQPQRLLIDGNRFVNQTGVEYQTVVGGDDKYQSIAAASILAKTERDRQMAILHTEFPHYAWDKNKGYPTAAHRLAVQEHGLSPHHRRSFRIHKNEDK